MGHEAFQVVLDADRSLAQPDARLRESSSSAEGNPAGLSRVSPETW